MLRLGEEIELHALVEFGLSQLSSIQQRLPPLVEGAMQDGEENGGIFGEDLLRLVVEGAVDGDLFEDLLRVDGLGERFARFASRHDGEHTYMTRDVLRRWGGIEQRELRGKRVQYGG